MDIPGLTYVEEYIPQSQRIELIDKIKALPFKPILTADSRRIIQYGYKYSFNSKLKPEVIDPIPTWISNLVDLQFDQVIINEYKRHQSISPHIDNKLHFGPIIYSISLGATCDMEFAKDGIKKRLTLHDGSLLMLTDEARYKWSHSLRNNKPNTRYSLTYRTVC